MDVETKYADANGVRIAYQVFGSGDRDIVFIWGTWSHIELAWEMPGSARFLRRLASLGRTVHFDKRGIGLSDPVEGAPTLEERMEDVRAVMDAAGMERAALIGTSEGAALAILFSATYPHRASHLAIYGGFARIASSEDYPLGYPSDVITEVTEALTANWGEGGLLPVLAPGKAHDEAFHREWGRFERYAVNPAMYRKLAHLALEIDIRGTLSSVQTPTLVTHRSGDAFIPVQAGRYLADKIPGARFVELPGADHLFTVDPDQIADEIEEFLTGTRARNPSDRVLTTVIFTDINRSTELAAQLGDRGWHEVMERHDAEVRRQLARFRGAEVKTLGDGFMATFDGPARAIACALAIREAVKPLGLSTRAGIHTGECEFVDGDVRGIAVNLAARITAKAATNEVLVSSTVRDLVAGSGIHFDEFGEHSLKGIPGSWRLFEARS